MRIGGGIGAAGIFETAKTSAVFDALVCAKPQKECRKKIVRAHFLNLQQIFKELQGKGDSEYRGHMAGRQTHSDKLRIIGNIIAGIVVALKITLEILKSWKN